MPTDDPIFRYFDAFGDLLTSMTGVSALALALSLLIACLMFPALRWPMLTLVLFTSSTTPAQSRWFDLTLAYPLNILAEYSRFVVPWLLLCMVAATVRLPPTWRQRKVSSPTVVLLIFQLVISARLIVAGVGTRGLLSIISYLLLFAVLGLCVSNWLRTSQDVRKVFWSVVMAGVLLIACTFYQLAINASAITPQGRLYAITANPQTAAMILALVITAATGLVMMPMTTLRSRGLLLGVLGVAAILLLWTGSRTGVAMTAIALVLLFRARIFLSLVVAAIVAGAVFLGLELAEGPQSGIERMMTAGNTRIDVWQNLIRDFVSNPVFGRVEGTIEVGESSILTAAARFGLLGVMVLALLAAAVGRFLFRLNRIRSRGTKETRVMSDLMIATLISLAATSFFEAILFSVFHFWLFVMYLYFESGSLLIEMHQRAPQVAPGAVDFEPALGTSGVSMARG